MTTAAAAAPKAKKAAKPKTPAAHPPYAAMIKAAVKALGDKKGSSRQAILKYICANYKVDAHQQTRQSLDYDMRDANKDPTVFTATQTRIMGSKSPLLVHTGGSKEDAHLHQVYIF